MNYDLKELLRALNLIKPWRFALIFTLALVIVTMSLAPDLLVAAAEFIQEVSNENQT